MPAIQLDRLIVCEMSKSQAKPSLAKARVRLSEWFAAVGVSSFRFAIFANARLEMGSKVRVESSPRVRLGYTEWPITSIMVMMLDSGSFMIVGDSRLVSSRRVDVSGIRWPASQPVGRASDFWASQRRCRSTGSARGLGSFSQKRWPFVTVCEMRPIGSEICLSGQNN